MKNITQRIKDYELFLELPHLDLSSMTPSELIDYEEWLINEVHYVR